MIDTDRNVRGRRKRQHIEILCHKSPKSESTTRKEERKNAIQSEMLMIICRIVSRLLCVCFLFILRKFIAAHRSCSLFFFLLLLSDKLHNDIMIKRYYISIVQHTVWYFRGNVRNYELRSEKSTHTQLFVRTKSKNETPMKKTTTTHEKATNI